MSVSNPLFSIIIPTYNRAALLKQAMQSVLEQSYVHWELLIIDDGSTDATKSVVKNQTDARIRYFYQENAERSAARNHGLDKARGQYLCFLDDDDRYLPHFLADFEKEITARGLPQGIIFRTGFIRQKEAGPEKAINYDARHHQNRFRFAVFEMCSAATLCIPAALLKTLRFPENIHYWEDTHFILRLFLEAVLVQLPGHQYLYVHHEQMSSRSFYQDEQWPERVVNNIAGMNDLFDRYGDQLRPYLPAWTHRYLIAEKYLDHALSAIQYSKREAALGLLKQSWREGGLHWRLARKYAALAKRLLG